MEAREEQPSKEAWLWIGVTRRSTVVVVVVAIVVSSCCCSRCSTSTSTSTNTRRSNTSKAHTNISAVSPCLPVSLSASILRFPLASMSPCHFRTFLCVPLLCVCRCRYRVLSLLPVKILTRTPLSLPSGSEIVVFATISTLEMTCSWSLGIASLSQRNSCFFQGSCHSQRKYEVHPAQKMPEPSKCCRARDFATEHMRHHHFMYPFPHPRSIPTLNLSILVKTLVFHNLLSCENQKHQTFFLVQNHICVAELDNMSSMQKRYTSTQRSHPSSGARVTGCCCWNAARAIEQCRQLALLVLGVCHWKSK